MSPIPSKTQAKGNDNMSEERESRSSAEVSECGRFRYLLERYWDDELETLAWIMLNPSTADGEKDDPTIRKCVGFAKRLGFGSIVVANLGAYRATSPKVWARAVDPIGPDNWTWLNYVRQFDTVIAAWGASPMPDTAMHVVTYLSRDRTHPPLHCLGRTRSGAPRHPLMLPYTAQLEVWP